MREYYGDNKLKEKDVRPAILVDFEGIAKHHNVNIMLYEPKKDRGKDAGSMCWLPMVRFNVKGISPQLTWDYWVVTAFTLKRWM